VGYNEAEVKEPMRKAKRYEKVANLKLGDLMTVQEVAQRLGRTGMTVRRLIKRKRLQAVLLGSRVMVVRESLERYLRPRPYKPQKGVPVCAGWNESLRVAATKATQPGVAP
jgi:excisionase family DNA binding protein